MGVPVKLTVEKYTQNVYLFFRVTSELAILIVIGGFIIFVEQAQLCLALINDETGVP